jgi:hypothetical protein
MKTLDLLDSPETWCQEAPGKDAQGNKVSAFDPRAVKWCALGAIQKIYHPSRWEEKMDRLLRALSVSEAAIVELTKTDKACYLMEWNDEAGRSFDDVREVLDAADI